jgi:hypothetical protein
MVLVPPLGKDEFFCQFCGVLAVGHILTLCASYGCVLHSEVQSQDCVVSVDRSNVQPIAASYSCYVLYRVTTMLSDLVCLHGSSLVHKGLLFWV